MAIHNWGYKIIDIPIGDTELEKQLNMLGSEGWELVTYSTGTFVFKRPNYQATIPTFTGEGQRMPRPERAKQ